MNKVVYLALTRKAMPVKIDVVQGSTAPGITFILEDYTPPVGANAELYISKPSEEIIFNACTINGNEIVYTPTTQSFAEVGENKAQLQIVGNGTAITFTMIFDVSENIIDGSAIESQSEFTALEEALETVSQYDDRIEQNTAAIEANATAIRNNINTVKYNGGAPDDATTSVPSDDTNWSVIGSFTPDTNGVYFVMAFVRFNANSNGYRALKASSNNATDGTGALGVSSESYVAPAPGNYTSVRIVFTTTLTGGQTYYLKAQQNCGGSLNIASRMSLVKLRS